MSSRRRADARLAAQPKATRILGGHPSDATSLHRAPRPPVRQGRPHHGAARPRTELDRGRGSVRARGDEVDPDVLEARAAVHPEAHGCGGAVDTQARPAELERHEHGPHGRAGALRLRAALRSAGFRRAPGPSRPRRPGSRARAGPRRTGVGSPALRHRRRASASASMARTAGAARLAHPSPRLARGPRRPEVFAGWDEGLASAVEAHEQLDRAVLVQRLVQVAALGRLGNAPGAAGLARAPAD